MPSPDVRFVRQPLNGVWTPGHARSATLSRQAFKASVLRGEPARSDPEGQESVTKHQEVRSDHVT